jgi:LacI family transcriptional regulator
MSDLSRGDEPSPTADLPTTAALASPVDRAHAVSLTPATEVPIASESFENQMTSSLLLAPRATLRDVAALAGVSFKTVSRVVNNEVGVSLILTERVRSAVTELGYRPDDRARRLRTPQLRTNIIGFILVDVANPFFSSILRGIEDVARKRDCLVLSGSTDGDSERWAQLVSAFVSRRVDGLIVVPNDENLGPLEHEIRRRTPLVFVDRDAPAQSEVDSVRSDHYRGSFLATKHLIEAGHRDIAFFGSPFTISSARQRFGGFRDAMVSESLSVPDNRVQTGTKTPEEWRLLVADFLEQPSRPTALFTAQNFATLGALQALHASGLQNTIAQVGFDDVELGAFLTPGLTVVPQSPLDIGRRATEILFDRIDGATHPPVYEVLKTALIERGSGEIRP